MADAYVDATEKYAAQVQLSSDGTRLEHYIAGRPFPRIDPVDPQAALRIMFNYRYGEGQDSVTFERFHVDTGAISLDAPLRIERLFIVGSFRRLYYVGRLWGEPKPSIPNSDGLHYQEGLFPFIEPFDLKGTGILTYRYIDPLRPDDSWLYSPSVRRVRRLSTAQRSDSLFGQDTDLDSYGGYAGKLVSMDWRLLGEQEVLGAFHTTHSPVKWADGAADWAFDGEWEKRQVYVIEGIPRDPGYSYSKRVLYIDKEVFRAAYSDIYDRQGHLWKVWINNFRFDATTSAEILPAILMVDVQDAHVTRAALPSHLARYAPDRPSATASAVPGDFTIARLLTSR